MATDYNTRLLDDVEKMIKECEEEAIDLEWDGDFDMAEIIRSELDELYALRNKGQKYAPRF